MVGWQEDEWDGSEYIVAAVNGDGAKVWLGDRGGYVVPDNRQVRRFRYKAEAQEYLENWDIGDIPPYTDRRVELAPPLV